MASNVGSEELNLFIHVLSTITSPVFPEVIVIYQDCDFRGVQSTWFPSDNPFRLMLEAKRAEEASWHHSLFEVFREMRKVRDFRLILCAHVEGRLAEYIVWVLKQIVATEKARRGFDTHFTEPSVICTRQEFGPELFRRLSYACWPPLPMVITVEAM